MQVCSHDYEVKVFFEKKQLNSLVDKYTDHDEKTGRVRFLNRFHIELNNKLINLNCYLKNLSNWFRKVDSKKWSAPIWRGNYICRFPGCGIKYRAIIHEIPINDDIEISVQYSSIAKHNKLEIKNLMNERCSGKIRQKVALDILSYGVSNTKAKNIIHKKENNNITSLFFFDSRKYRKIPLVTPWGNKGPASYYPMG